jgi:phenylalanyl-tRNA synthetase beta chain
MPTITLKKTDIETLLGHPLSLSKLEESLSLVKGELKDAHAGIDEIKIELNDSNRPDLWCAEGIARQLRCREMGRHAEYPFFKSNSESPDRIIVGEGMREVRPYIAACKVKRLSVDDEMLAQMIQTQEKLAEVFGKKREMVSIGLYRLGPIVFPVRYEVVPPDSESFVPLGFEESMTLSEILDCHPKGIEYGRILVGKNRIPLLKDAEGKILSLPPIINSSGVGEVRIGDSDLMVEVTGSDLRLVLLALNIFAVNLHDRGGSVEQIEVAYPYETEMGATLRMPLDIADPVRLETSDVKDALGLDMEPDYLESILAAYGYRLSRSGNGLDVRCPPYRDDILHVVDVVEDVAISAGYDQFPPEMPAQFSVGGLSPEEELSDRVRELLAGCGFQEVISNILCSRVELVDRMGIGNSRLVEIDNPMSSSYSVVRNWITPSLLRVEAASSKAFYPHRIFEVGEVAELDLNADMGSRTLMKVSALIAHASANFSEAHSILGQLFYYLDLDYRLEACSHPSFIDGRVGRISTTAGDVGVIGELHPKVLEAWEVKMPASVFEVDLSRVMIPRQS